MATFNCICETRSRLGESPRWHHGERKVYWTDIDGKILLRVGLDGEEPQFAELKQKAGCLVFREGGGLVLAMEDGIYAGDPFADEGEMEMLCPHPDPALAASGGRFNDGRCDSAGRLYVGTLDPTKAGLASFYVLEPGEKAARTVQGGFSTFNGIAFHPEGDEVWYSDTPQYELYRSSYDPGTGVVGERDIVKSWDSSESSRPDGGAFDSAGDYWCAMYAGGCVLRLDGAGTVLDEHQVPATYTTMPAFVGDDLDRMVVTTGLREDDMGEQVRNPMAGCLFMLDETVPQGMAEPAFAG